MKFKVGFTSGVYDMFHIGHLNLLRGAKAHCEKLIVGVSTDELVESYKGHLPVIPFAERMEIVKSVRYVDAVVAQVSFDRIAIWEELRFDSMFIGDDWKGSPRWSQYEQDFADKGVSIVYLPYTQTISSTILRGTLESVCAPTD
jgi:glycerol-3-phosphate cytidylyltransferase